MNPIFMSDEFDDIYFSKEDGIEETKHVFLEGNQIPNRWKLEKQEVYRIGELGFGTGLNFFVSLELWMNLSNPPGVEFFTLEKFPLERTILLEMKESFPNLKTWEDELLQAYTLFLADPLDAVEGNRKLEWKVQHPMNQNTFTLHLFLGDVLEVLPKFQPPIDCYFLDGFAPKKNPEMWSEAVVLQLKAHAKSGTSFATFTAAGFVKRNLESAGFTVRKVSGFGKKREMLVGYLA